MIAMNVVHMRVKPGKEEEFMSLHREFERKSIPGAMAQWVMKSGERSYIVVGEWESTEALIAARPKMIGHLDRLRPFLEDLGGGRGVTEPWSGEVVLKL